MKVVIVAAFVVFALLSALAAYLLFIVLSEAAIDDSVVIWPTLLICAAILAATVALGRPALKALKPVTAEALHARLKALRPPDVLLSLLGRYPSDNAQLQAIARMLARDRRAASRLGLGPDRGFDALTRLAEAAAARRDPDANECWQDLGVLFAGLDDERAIAALKRANEIDSMDVITLYLLGQRYVSLGRWDEARHVGEIGARVAKSDHQRVFVFINDATAAMMNADPRAAAMLAEKLVPIAQAAPPDLLDMIEQQMLVPIDAVAIMVSDASDTDFVAGRWVWTAYVALLRVMAQRRGTTAARAALAKALIGAGEWLIARANSDEGHTLLAEGRKLAGSGA